MDTTGTAAIQDAIDTLKLIREHLESTYFSHVPNCADLAISPGDEVSGYRPYLRINTSDALCRKIEIEAEQTMLSIYWMIDLWHGPALVNLSEPDSLGQLDRTIDNICNVKGICTQYSTCCGDLRPQTRGPSQRII